MQVFFHPDFYQVYTSDPAAEAGRMEAVISALEPEVALQEPRPATLEEIAAAHTSGHIERVRGQGLFDIAALAAGGAVAAAEAGMHAPAFALVRPPGIMPLRRMPGGFVISIIWLSRCMRLNVGSVFTAPLCSILICTTATAT